MSQREKIKKFVVGASDREADSIREWFEEQSATNRFARSSHWQAAGLQLERAYPRLRGLIGKQGEAPGQLAFRVLSLVADDTKNAEVARPMGGRGSESRHEV